MVRDLYQLMLNRDALIQRAKTYDIGLSSDDTIRDQQTSQVNDLNTSLINALRILCNSLLWGFNFGILLGCYFGMPSGFMVGILQIVGSALLLIAAITRISIANSTIAGTTYIEVLVSEIFLRLTFLGALLPVIASAWQWCGPLCDWGLL